MSSPRADDAKAAADAKDNTAQQTTTPFPDIPETIPEDGNPTSTRETRRVSVSRRPEGGRPASNSVSARLASVAEALRDSTVPSGMWAATAENAAQMPTIGEIKEGGPGYSARARGNSINAAARKARRSVSNGNADERFRSGSTKIDTDEIDALMRMTGNGRMDAQAFDVSKSKRSTMVGGVAPDTTISKAAMENVFAQELDGTGRDEEEDDKLFEGYIPKQRRSNRTSKNLSEMLGEEVNENTIPLDKLSKTGKVSIDEQSQVDEHPIIHPDAEGNYPNGYRFPPKKTWGEATMVGLRAFWKFSTTITGFLIVIYGLNVMAWGAMIFFLLLNAAPAMCVLGNGEYNCNDINSPRRVWIEYDSQILTALFCVTAFGLLPWRLRDAYYLTKWSVMKRRLALRRLAGYHASWYRMPGSNALPIPVATEDPQVANQMLENNDSFPTPLKNAPGPPLTGVRAPDTASWKMHFVVWNFILNTVFQVVLCGFMWGDSRYDRPSWATGLFVSLGCISAGVAGLMQFIEGKKVKAAEGVAWDTHERYAAAEKEVISPANLSGEEGNREDI